MKFKTNSKVLDFYSAEKRLLQQTVKWYKIHYVGWQVVCWDFQNKQS